MNTMKQENAVVFPSWVIEALRTGSVQHINAAPAPADDAPAPAQATIEATAPATIDAPATDAPAPAKRTRKGKAKKAKPAPAAPAPECPMLEATDDDAPAPMLPDAGLEATDDDASAFYSVGLDLTDV